MPGASLVARFTAAKVLPHGRTLKEMKKLPSLHGKSRRTGAPAALARVARAALGSGRAPCWRGAQPSQVRLLLEGRCGPLCAECDVGAVLAGPSLI